MAGPWEQYQSSSAEPSGPWSEYRSLPEVVVTADREPVSEIPAARRSYGLAEVPGAFVTNIPSSAKRFAQEAYTALTHPVQTAKGVLDIGAGAIQSVLPQQVVNWVNQFEANPEAGRQVVEAARAAGGVIADRWGSYENAKRTLAEDPVGAMADLSTILTGAAGVTKLAGKGQRALTGGGVIPAEQALVGGLETAAKYTNPFSAVTVPVQGALAFKERVLPGALTKQKEANAVRDATLAAGTAEGYMTTPGSVTPQGKNILAERMAGKTYLEQLMAVNNQEVTNNLARRAVGIGETAPLTSENMRSIRKAEYEKGYKPIERLGDISTDAQYLDDMVNVEAKYTGPSKSFPGAVPDEVAKLIKTYTVGKFDSKDAVQVMRHLREEARANFNKGDVAIANAQTDIAKALENQIERTLATTPTPNANTLLEQFRLSRQRMAISHSVEDAILEGGGSVNADKLARDLQKGAYLSGDLRTIGEFANVFPRVTRSGSSIGTPGAGTMLGAPVSGLGGVIGGGLGYMAGDYGGAGFGVTAGLYAPQLVSAAMRNYLMSPGVQRNLAPNYTPLTGRIFSDVAAQNALLATQAGNITNQNNLRK